MTLNNTEAPTAVTGQSAVIVNVTPELALHWLQRNGRNRNVRRVQVAKWAAEISRGAWVLNGESIKFATSGDLLDGQHRLMAIVKAGRAIDTWVVFGLPDSAQDVMDGGKQRSAADVLSIGGHKSSAALAAVARLLIQYYGPGLEYHHCGGETISTSEIVEFARSNLELLEWATGLSVGGDSRCPRSALGASAAVILTAHDYGSDQRRSDVEEFICRVKDGSGVIVGTPIATLRSQQLRLDQRARGVGRLRPSVYVALNVRTWNKHRKGGPSSRIRVYGSDGAIIPCPMPSR